MKIVAKRIIGVRVIIVGLFTSQKKLTTCTQKSSQHAKKSSQHAKNSSQYAMPVRTNNLVTSSQIVDCFQLPMMRSCTEG